MGPVGVHPSCTMSCCTSHGLAEFSCNASAPARIALIEELKANSRGLADGSINYMLSVPVIHCGNCISTIEGTVAGLEGVKAVRANLTMRQVSVTMASEEDSIAPVIEAMEAAGYLPQPAAVALEDKDPEFKMLVRALAVAGFAAANIMLLSVAVWNGAEGATRDLFHMISALIAIPAVGFAGQPFFRSAIAVLKRGRMNMDVPISLGVTLATFMSMYEIFIGGGHAYFDAAVSLLFFLLIGRTLDHMMRTKARAAAGRLARLSAKGGFVVGPNGDAVYTPLDALRPGMVLRVSAGERFPVDATVIDGVSDVDRALVTGESDPQRVVVGTGVEAGTLNLTGSVDIRATRAARDSFLAEVTRMMAAAEQGRGSYTRVADRMAKIYSPAVHLLALTSFIGWMIWTGGDWHTSLTVAVAVLIITCPCALGLAVPVAHIISAGRLFEAGVLMKDGSALERLESMTNAVFDKTGTLTTGEPSLRTTAIPEGELASIAKAMAQRSVHPASRALAKSLVSSQTVLLSDLHEVAGQGVEAVVNGKRARLGRREWVAEIASGNASGEGNSAFAVEGQGLYLSSFSEQLRAGAKTMLDTLKQRGIHTTMLSGDAIDNVATVAKRLGLDDYEAGLKPGDKMAFLQTAAAQGQRTLMVGDGLNDAPALAAAHVSMAPSTASDVGRNAADFVFTRDSLDAVTFACNVALRTGSIVRQNFALAIVYNVFAVPLAMSGYLNPLIAAIAMSSSSIIVVANSLRLQMLKPKKTETPVQAVPTGRIVTA